LRLQLLEPLKKYPVANNAKKNLEQIKIKWFNLAVKPAENTGILFITLKNMQESDMITIFESSADQKSNFQMTQV
jgi:hypothetical protein